MKKFYYVILSMIAIALVSCTSELDEINNTVHQQETLSGNELGANLMKSFQNAVSRSSEIKHLSYPSLLSALASAGNIHKRAGICPVPWQHPPTNNT